MKVDIMCIGAAKSGTSWLAHVLGQHPELYIPRQKEIHYFNSKHPIRLDANPNFKKGIDWYHAHFSKAENGQLKADFSTSYLSSSSAARAIYEYNPEVRIMVLLRDPVDRALSAQRFFYGRGAIREKSLIEAINSCHAVGEEGMYYKNLLPYFRLFPADQIGVFFYDDLARPEILTYGICEFLKISPFTFTFPNASVNQTKVIKRESLHQMVTRFKLGPVGNFLVKSGIGGFFNRFYDWNSGMGEHAALSVDYRNRLKNHYEEDILKLEKLIGKPLDQWK